MRAGFMSDSVAPQVFVRAPVRLAAGQGGATTVQVTGGDVTDRWCQCAVRFAGEHWNDHAS